MPIAASISEEYIKSKVVDGKVILNKIRTTEITKERALKRLQDLLESLQEDLVTLLKTQEDLEAEILKTQTHISNISKITVGTEIL